MDYFIEDSEVQISYDRTYFSRYFSSYIESVRVESNLIIIFDYFELFSLVHIHENLRCKINFSLHDFEDIDT